MARLVLPVRGIVDVKLEKTILIFESLTVITDDQQPHRFYKVDKREEVLNLIEQLRKTNNKKQQQTQAHSKTPSRSQSTSAVMSGSTVRPTVRAHSLEDSVSEENSNNHLNKSLDSSANITPRKSDLSAPKEAKTEEKKAMPTPKTSRETKEETVEQKQLKPKQKHTAHTHPSIAANTHTHTPHWRRLLCCRGAVRWRRSWGSSCMR